MSYWKILNNHPQYLFYGAFHYFFSSLGQTFLISVSVPFILTDLDLSSAAFSNSYGIATVVSALALPLVGGWIDRMKLSLLSIICGLGLIGACLVMSGSYHLYTLVAGMFLLRFFGQGGMVLIGSTAIAKFFSKNRGKALSLASMGLAIAETIMPMIIIAFINWQDWRTSWMLLAALVVLLFIPITQLLLKKHSGHQEEDHHDGSRKPVVDFTRTQVLKDPKFYLILPAFVFLPFFITGIFIHQNMLATAQGWTMEWMAFSFVSYGVMKVATSFLGGALIDRFSARKVFICYLLPLALGMVLLLVSDHRMIALAYMALLGMTASLGSLTGIAMWAELYGVKNLGAIKSMTTTFMVIATALGPIAIGWGLEISLNQTLYACLMAIGIIVLTNFYVILKKT